MASNVQRIVTFMKIRAAEAALLWLVFIVFALFFKDQFWPYRPNDALHMLTGTLFPIVFFFFFCGYILTSALAFALAGVLSVWRPRWLALAGGLTFAIHALVIIKVFRLEMGLLSSAAWAITVAWNVALPFIFRPDRTPLDIHGLEVNNSMYEVEHAISRARRIAYFAKSSNLIDIQIGPDAKAAWGIDSVFIMNYEDFSDLSSISDDKQYFFVHHFDEIGNPPWDNADLNRRVTVVHSSNMSRIRNAFVAQSEDFDAIATNFNRGAVIPASVSWIGLCLLECDLALILARDVSQIDQQSLIDKSLERSDIVARLSHSVSGRTLGQVNDLLDCGVAPGLR
jgi:hypothetical protein